MMNRILSFSILLVLTVSLSSMIISEHTSRIFKGTVIGSDGNPLIGVNVLVKGTDLSAITDIHGNFEIEIEDEETILVFSYAGYQTHEEVITYESEKTIQLKTAEYLDEVIYKEDEDKSPRLDLLEGKTSGITIASASDKKIRIRGISDSAPTSDKRSLKKSYTSFSVADGIPGGAKKITSGTLTAGEWNDLNNWDDWKELLKNPDFTEMESYWSFKMKNRYSVFITNKYELPVVDAQVLLKGTDGKIVWETKTDNSGKAELWDGIFSDVKSLDQLFIDVRYNGKPYTIETITRFEDGVNHLQLDQGCDPKSNVDIMFVVDATGSMGDEIAYLKTELEDVVSRVKSVDRDLKFNIGSVFYRDEGDEYVTKTAPLSSNINESIKFFQENRAAGGGDYPEAVHSGLQEALDQPWNSNAIARIIFLLLDAPPHHNPEVIKELQMQVEEAAKLGIKIIPITASGINRQTEFLMKFFSLSTNGTYVFLTDDSGVGEKHLSPLVDDYEVEKLNDLLVRLISNFTKSKGCDNQQQGDDWKSTVKIYPNPTSNFVNVYLEEDTDKLLLRSASGMVVYTQNNLPIGETKIQLESMVDGVYTIQFIKGPNSVSKQLILIN